MGGGEGGTGGGRERESLGGGEREHETERGDYRDRERDLGRMGRERERA